MWWVNDTMDEALKYYYSLLRQPNSAKYTKEPKRITDAKSEFEKGEGAEDVREIEERISGEKPNV